MQKAKTAPLFSLAVALFLLPFAASAAATPGKPAAQDEAAWRAKMQSLYTSLQGLLAITVDPVKFNDPSQSRAIETHARGLVQAAHAMAAAPSTSPDMDPSIRLFSGILEEQSAQALQAYKLGSREYARTLFNSTASQCIACHSRTDAGVKMDWKLESGPAASLPLQYQAQILAAGRAYAPALEKLNSVLTDPATAPAFAKEKPFEWNQALRTALILAVRAERNPTHAASILESAMKTEGVPQFVKWDSRDWLRTLRAWEQEIKSGQDPASSKSLKTESGYHREALRLIAVAQKAQRFPMDRSADMLYLRASAVLHEQLSRFPQGTRSAEAFFLLGVCYEILRDFDLWTLGDTYFEACIHRSPHTTLSESCYRKLEESILAGYTGSAGTRVPVEVEGKLQRLRLEAQASTTAPDKVR